MAKVKLNLAGFTQLRKSPEVVAAVKDEAEKICEAAKNAHDADGYAVSTWEGSTRTIATVQTADIHAMRSNLKYNTLLKALGGGK